MFGKVKSFVLDSLAVGIALLIGVKFLYSLHPRLEPFISFDAIGAYAVEFGLYLYASIETVFPTTIAGIVVAIAIPVALVIIERVYDHKFNKPYVAKHVLEEPIDTNTCTDSNGISRKNINLVKHTD